MNTTIKNSDYYPFFDYLRIVLACVVMLYHDNVLHWSNSGDLAVQIFFALSGWLIGGILLNISTNDLPHFYMNRALRIWVPYYLALLFILAASVLRDHLGFKWLEFVFYKISFVYNLFGPPQLADYREAMPLRGTGNHFWSVNAEEQFYLIAPILLVVAAAKAGRHVVLWIALAVAAWWFNVYASIVFGVLAAVVVKRFGPIHLSLPCRAILLAGFSFTAIGLLLDYSYFALAPFFAICTVLLLALKGKQEAYGKFLGGVSYPLYLNHWIGVYVGNAIFSPVGLRDSPLRQLIAALFNLLIAAALYWYVDRRILAMRDTIFSIARGKFIMFSSYAMVLFGTIGGLMYGYLG